MKVKPDEEMDEGRGRAIKDGRRRAEIIGRRSGHISGRRRHPIGSGAVLDVAELIGAPRHGGNKKQSECGEEANEELFHHSL
jgi:hypothetical protein